MRTTCLLTILLLAAPLVQAVDCNDAFIAEGQSPPAIDGITTAVTGFNARLWAWGANPAEAGSTPIGLTDDATGIAINHGLLWANVPACTGTIQATALLVEAQTPTTGGTFALVVVDAEGQVDRYQDGSIQSVAAPVPIPAVHAAASGTDGFGAYVDFQVTWSFPSAAWALTTEADVLAGARVYYATDAGGGPVNTGDKTAFTSMSATPTGAAPYVVDDPDTQDGLLPASHTTCHVRIRPGTTVYVALALIFDGTGATGERQTDPSAVESTYASACTAALSTTDAIFADGFETGNTSAWSETTP